MIVNSFALIGCSAILFLEGIWMFYLARLLIGITVGIFAMIVPLYINEISPRNISASLGVMVELMINLGQFCAYLLGAWLPKTDDSEAVAASNFYMFML